MKRNRQLKDRNSQIEKELACSDGSKVDLALAKISCLLKELESLQERIEMYRQNENKREIELENSSQKLEVITKEYRRGINKYRKQLTWISTKVY